jgi:hypothetical protein
VAFEVAKCELRFALGQVVRAIHEVSRCAPVGALSGRLGHSLAEISGAAKGAERELLPVHATRGRTEAGFPIVHGLNIMAVCLFDDIWQKAREQNFDEACAQLIGLYEIAKFHPALAPECALLKQIWDASCALSDNDVSKTLDEPGGRRQISA